MGSLTNLNRREFLRLTAAGGSLALLAACVPAQAPGTQAPSDASQAAVEAVTLRWWAYYEPTTRCLLCGDFAQEFEEANPGVTIETSILGSTGYSERLAAAFSAGDPPELYGTTRTTWAIQVQDGVALNLGDWYRDTGMIDKVHPGAQAWCTYDGELYGISAWDLFCQEWYYNATVFEELGIEEPKTEDDLYVIAPLLAERVRYPFLIGGSQVGLWSELLAVVQAQTCGITPILAAAESKDYHIPELLTAVEKCDRMFKEGLISQDALGITGQDLVTTFASGEVGLITFHTGWQPRIKESVEAAGGSVKLDLFKDAVLFVPEPKSPWASGYAMVWAVPQGNQYPEQTLDFLTYLMSPDVQRRIASAGGGIPPLQETWDAITDPLLQTSIKHLGESTAESLFLVDFLHPRVVESVYTSMLAMAQGTGTPEQVLDAMTEAVQTV